MKKREGFTLVELLGVVTILAIIAALALPKVTDVLSNNDQKLYDITINNIKSVMGEYASKNILNLPEDTDIYLTLYQLAESSSIGYKIENPITKENISLDTILVIKNHNNELEYEVNINDEDPKYDDDTLDNLPKLKLYDSFGNHLSDSKTNIKLATINGVDKSDEVIVNETSTRYTYTLEDESNNISVKAFYNIVSE